jgi:hypothetical protein
LLYLCFGYPTLVMNSTNYPALAGYQTFCATQGQKG